MFEEVGYRVADLLVRDNPSLASTEAEYDHHDHHQERLMQSMDRSLKSAARGFNQRAGADLLTVVDRYDGFQFHFRYELTATLRVGPYLLGLVPGRKNVDNPSVAKFTLACTEHDGFEFKLIPIDSDFTTSPMNQAQFVEGVIKVACNKNFYAE